ncbi:MAG: LysM peptidoglycan-binding domain-containing protein [Bacteroidetes bacterium]|nr:LysM peptidoglycan-binding domain-containing protein [Bacteroidota bacterium]
MGLGELQKMKLVAYEDAKFSTPSNIEYEVLINPETYSLTYSNFINDKSAQGSSESVSSTNKRAPQSITFNFLFDGTGVLKRGSGGLLSGIAVPGLPSDKPDVLQDYENFRQVVYAYDSGTHKPRFVQIQWGPLLYNCQLTNMTISFKLFRPDGTPVRAEADCTFQAVIDEEKLSTVENKNSPDLTHVRTVREGDTLPLLCFREYGDSKYYFEVARVNGLTDFKQLTPGMKLVFPPFAK